MRFVVKSMIMVTFGSRSALSSKNLCLLGHPGSHEDFFIWNCPFLRLLLLVTIGWWRHALLWNWKFDPKIDCLVFSLIKANQIGVDKNVRCDCWTLIYQGMRFATFSNHLIRPVPPVLQHIFLTVWILVAIELRGWVEWLAFRIRWAHLTFIAVHLKQVDCVSG